MRMRYPYHFNIGPADSAEGSCELVKVVSSLSTMANVIRFYLRIINHGVIRQDCLRRYISHVYILVYFRVFTCSFLLRCMFEV